MGDMTLLDWVLLVGVVGLAYACYLMGVANGVMKERRRALHEGDEDEHG